MPYNKQLQVYICFMRLALFEINEIGNVILHITVHSNSKHNPVESETPNAFSNGTWEFVLCPIHFPVGVYHKNDPISPSSRQQVRESPLWDLGPYGVL